MQSGQSGVCGAGEGRDEEVAMRSVEVRDYQLPNLYASQVAATGVRSDGQYFVCYETVQTQDDKESQLQRLRDAKDRCVARVFDFDREGCYCRVITVRSNRYPVGYESRSISCAYHRNVNVAA